MKEGLSSKHGRELLGDSLEDLLDGRRVANESGCHRQTSRSHVTNGRLDIVGNPFHKVTVKMYTLFC